MSAQKTSWADDVDELAEPVSDYIDENGIRITIEYAINDEGKKVKVSSTTLLMLSICRSSAYRSLARSSGPSRNLSSNTPSQNVRNGQNLARRGETRRAPIVLPRPLARTSYSN